MSFPLTSVWQKSKHSRTSLALVGLLSALWAAALTGTETPAALATAVALTVAASLCCGSTLRRGAAAMLVLSPNRDATVATAWLAGLAFGTLLALGAAAGLPPPPGLEGEPAALWFLASAASLLAGHHATRALAADFEEPRSPAAPLGAPATVAVGVMLTTTLAIAWIVPGAWATIMPAAVALAIGLLASVLPGTDRAVIRGVERVARERLPDPSGVVPLETLAEIEAIVLEKSDVLTTTECEIRDVVCLDPGSCEDDVLHLAAIAEYIVPPHPIRTAVLRRARSGLRTVPTLKRFHHTPGRGISARLNGQELLVGNLAWLRERGWSREAVEEARQETRVLYERGETVLYVCRGGRILGALSIFDPPRPDSDAFLDRSLDIGCPISVISGDSPETVRELLGRSGDVEVLAGLRPEERIRALERTRLDRGKTALVARSGSPLLPEALGVADVVFAFDRKSDTTTISSRWSEPLALHGASLERVSFALELARTVWHSERRVRLWSRLYHWVAVPTTFTAACFLANWKTWPACGILLGVVAAWAAVASRHRLAAGCGDPRRDRSGRPSDATASESDARPDGADAEVAPADQADESDSSVREELEHA